MRYIVFLFLSSLFLSCNQATGKNDDDFEGVIVYGINYPNQIRPLDVGGTTSFKIYYKGGNIRKEYRNSDDSLLFFSIYSFRENINYGFTPGSDIVNFYKTFFDSLATRERITDKKHNKTILGYECAPYLVSVPGSEIADEEPAPVYKFFISEKLKVKEVFNDNVMNFVLSENSNIVLGYEMNLPVQKTVTAKQVLRQRLNDSLFTINLAGKTLEPL